MKFWTDRETFITTLLRPMHVVLEIKDVLTTLGFDRSVSSIQRFCQRKKLSYIKAGMFDISDLEMKIREEDIIKAIKIMYNKFRPTAKFNLEENSVVIPEAGPIREILPVREAFNIVRNHLNEIRAIVPRKPKSIQSMTDYESCVVLLSDIHMGKVIRNSKSEQIYNIRIALERLRQVTDSIIRIMSYAERSTQIDEIVIALNGDIVDNEIIYETQVHHIETFAIEQVRFVTKALWEMLVTVSETLQMNVRVETARGNHGRTLGHEESNWDNIVYQELQLLADMREGNSITVNTQYGEYSTFKIRGWNFLMRHVAPAQCETAAAMKKFAGWADKHRYHAMMIGHWHHWGIELYNNRPIFRNGCLCGADDLSERMAVFNDPVQMVFGVSKKRLPTFIYPLTLS